MVFLDTSALVKVYVTESGSDDVRALVGHHATLVSAATYVEARATFARRRRERAHDAEVLQTAQRSFESDWTRFGVINLAPALLRAAGDLCDRYPLRAGDAVQLASAVCVQQEGTRLTFVAADRRLLGAAAAEGLETLDVG